MFNLRILLPFLGALVLIGCKTNTTDIYKGLSAKEIYTLGETSVGKENFIEAAKAFEALEARFPYGDYSSKAQLALIHAYYKQNNAALALSAADRFIRMEPRHPNVDYAYYLKGLITFDQNYTFAFRYLPLDKSTRDPASAEESFDAFKLLVERFPNSQYVADARQRMIFLRNQLANYEYQVVEYYLKRGAYLSAANRANYIIQYYSETPAAPKALAAVVRAYRSLRMQKLADDALKTLLLNFPDSEEAKTIH